jgi:nitrogen fixation NifU-like protein
MNLESLYQEIILNHYKNPVGKVSQVLAEDSVHHVNPTCGDEITLAIEVKDGKTHISFANIGCSISQASASVMYELCEGQDFQKIMDIEDSFLELMQSRGQGIADDEILGDAIAFVGVSQFPARIKCALLPYMALKDAISKQDKGATNE